MARSRPETLRYEQNDNLYRKPGEGSYWISILLPQMENPGPQKWGRWGTWVHSLIVASGPPGIHGTAIALALGLERQRLEDYEVFYLRLRRGGQGMVIEVKWLHHPLQERTLSSTIYFSCSGVLQDNTNKCKMLFSFCHVFHT